MRAGIAASSIGRSILGRTLGTVLGGTVAGTAGILTSPYIAIANHLYGPNAQKAQDFVGMFGEAMPFSHIQWINMVICIQLINLIK
jgi:hypothetical protein